MKKCESLHWKAFGGENSFQCFWTYNSDTLIQTTQEFMKILFLTYLWNITVLNSTSRDSHDLLR